MFCKNCGKENADDAQHCVACGCDLNKALPAREVTANGSTIKARKKRIPKMLLIIICAVFVASFVLYQIAANVTKPETIVKNHISALVNGDFGAVYDGLDIPNGKFTSKKQFIASCASSSRKQEDRITSLSITIATAKDLEDSKPLSGSKVDAAYKVVYSTQLKPAPSTEFVMLTKKGKAFLLFDRYEVEPNNFVAQDYSIVAPVGIKVGLDGIELDNTFLSKGQTSQNDNNSQNQSENNVYTIPDVFFGKHKITAKSNFTENYEVPVDVKSGQTETINDLVVKADIRSKMHEMAEKTLRLFFDSMVANKNFTDISSQVNLVPAQADAIGKSYDSFKGTGWSNFDSRTVTCSNISITDIAAEQQSNSTLTNSSKAPLSYRLGYNVSCDVEPETGYFLLGNPHSVRHFEMNIRFSYENNELKIYSVGV